MSQEHLLLFLVQMLTVLGLARLLGEVFRRFGQPRKSSIERRWRDT